MCFPWVPVLLVAGCSQGLPAPTVDQTRENAAPRAHLPLRTVVLGDIPVDQGVTTREASFVIENRGSAELFLTRIQRECGCTALAPGDDRVAPGRSTTIRFRVSPQAPGHTRVRAVVETNDPDHSTKELFIQWHGVSTLEVMPASINFGTMRPGMPQRAEVHVRLRSPDLAGERPAWPPTLECWPGRLTARFAKLPEPAPASPIAQWEEGVLIVEVDAEEDPGAAEGAVIISLGSGAPAARTIRASWHIRVAIVATPARFFAGSALPDASVRASVAVLADPGESLDIDGVGLEPADPGFQLQVERTSTVSCLLNITWTLPALPGDYRRQVQIACRSPERRVLAVPISVHVAEPPP